MKNLIHGWALASLFVARAALAADYFSPDYEFPKSPAEPHCHKLIGSKLEDWPDIKDKSTCKQMGGRWRKHTFECHVLNVWPPKDMVVADQFDCKSQGGFWSDFGHEL